MLLFLHGYLSCKESFSYQISYFSRFYEVIAVDMAGFGENADLEYPYSLEDYAESVKRVIESLGDRKINVLAHSFGARVAIRLNTICGEKINKFVFTGAAGLRSGRGMKYLLKRASFFIAKNFVEKDKLKSFYSKDYLALNGVMKESFKKIIGEFLDDEAKKINKPTLIISGDKDRETPKRTAKKLHGYIKDSRLIFIKDAGHFCFVDNPDFFNGKVLAFLLGGKV